MKNCPLFVKSERAKSEGRKWLPNPDKYIMYLHKTISRVGQLLFRSSLFRSLQKERQRVISSFTLYQKSNKEQFALSLFTKRTTRSNSLFCSLPKERQGANGSFSLIKRATWSKKLFCSFQKEQQGAICSFALLKKSKKEQIALYLFTKTAKKSDSLVHSLPKER